MCSTVAVKPETGSPLSAYLARCEAGELDEDEHQKNTIRSLDRLYTDLEDYRPPEKQNQIIKRVRLFCS